jgi:hypothetical protein
MTCIIALPRIVIAFVMGIPLIYERNAEKGASKKGSSTPYQMLMRQTMFGLVTRRLHASCYGR